MLTCLRVRDFAIIEELEIEVGPGLTVITGETGAGKSILVDALELVLGGRGRPEVVRTGKEQAEVEALFDLSKEPLLVSRLREAGFDASEELLVRRVVQASGRTRAYVNGRLATAGQLAELAQGLADISSQHEHHTLVDPANHLECLDAFAELEALRTQVREAHADYAAAAAALARATSVESGRAEREDLLRFQLREIDELGLVAGEEETLREDRERLRHAEKLAVTAGNAEHALYARDGAIAEELGRMEAELREAARLDATLEPHVTGLERLRMELEELARDLGRYAQRVTADPEKLAAIEERLDKIGRLKRKYGGSVEAVLEHRARAATELDSLDASEDRIEALTQARDAARAKAATFAQKLSKERRKAADKLGRGISEELAALGMGGAQVLVEVERLAGRAGELEIEGARLTTTGIDRVEFLIAPNKGEQARPIRKIASGGELSRAMLAIKRVLGALGPAGLYVFDEVDSGVGGAVADAIGAKIKEVSLHQQVICITHLPQIAVYADDHLLVHKIVDDGRTKSSVRPLGSRERVEEVARMLGGRDITPKTRAAASEMLRTRSRTRHLPAA